MFGLLALAISLPSALAASPSYWFSFGDSYTQTGFNITDTLPAVGNPLGNPPYPGYTAVGGENWIDYVTTTYNKSTILTYNFAYGGATIDASLVAPYEPSVLSLTDQVNLFLDTVASKPTTTPWTSTNTLFSVWIGINDLGNSYYESGDRDAFSDTLLDAYFALIQDLFNVGARNFLFINVPPTDRSPLMVPQGAAACALLKSVIAGFNSKLVTRVSEFEGNNTGVATWVWDSNSVFSAILDDPTAYGFIDNSTYGSASDDFWGNTLHPSSYANVFFGEDVGALLPSTW